MLCFPLDTDSGMPRIYSTSTVDYSTDSMRRKCGVNIQYTYDSAIRVSGLQKVLARVLTDLVY